MKKDSIYIIFDELPLKSSGGLVASYANFVRAFKDEFTIKLVSVFNCFPSDIREFSNLEIINLSKHKIDNRFYRIIDYAKDKEWRKVAHAIFSAVCFFGYIPISRIRTRELLRGKKVIVSCPAAGIFISRNVKFIQEIHTSFDYFWGKNLIGRAQTFFAASPALTVFRSKTDAERGNSLFASNYIYSYFDDQSIDRIAFNFNQRRYKALFMGRLSGEKNPLMLLDCAELVRHSLPNFQLDIYGEGDLFVQLKSEVGRRGMEDYVALKGYCDDKSVFSQYSLLWLTSKNEGLPLVIIEAMANKVPVVSTRWGDAAGELIQNGINGFIVENSNEFAQVSIEIMRDKEKLSKLSSNAYRLYKERFTLESYKRKWQELLNAVYDDNIK